MRVLLDTCVWGGARATLEAAGHDVEWTGDWVEDPGDAEILRHATVEGRLLITLDKDFGELVIVRGQPHVGIVRLVNLSATEQGAMSVQVLQRYEAELRAGAIVTVEPGRVRVRPGTDPP